ncbi:O-antigen ligase family protein [Alkalimonas mucilaginosa]|uniref:O-antigen ligase n=1 Tax=Alkalimonas mucilaginosa TaxID=3057676 RepID=A0ABU7JFL3_9GAMM|nr:O-antigen ligase [Alkalimonas sp. MEB004]MEE2024478.1 O-antigen ligase [Alkalimonas sp. MEB004]
MIIRIPKFNYQNAASLLLGLLLAFSFTGLSPFSTSSGLDIELSDTGGGSFARQIIFIFFFGGALAIFLKKQNVSELQKIPLLLLFMGWCFLSIFWADHPAISVRRVALLLITVSTIFMLISCMTLDQTIICITRVLATLVIISLIAMPVLPGAVHTGAELFDTGLEGNWKGIFIHKNHAGPALMVAISLFLYQYYHKRSYVWLVLVFLAFIFLVFTKSKTSIALLMPSLMFGYLLYKTLHLKSFSNIVGIIYICILSLLFILREPIIDSFVSILDNPEAFTGRATIWDIILRAIQDHFWFGIGYGSVWSVGEDMLVAEYAFGWVDWVFTLTHAHNGYLEVLISLGIIGLTLCLATFVIMPFFKAVSLSNSSVHPFMFLFFSSFLFFTLHNMLETDFLNATDGRWFLILIFYFTLYLKGSELKQKRSW